jgi:large subunit ribosomal protein L24
MSKIKRDDLVMVISGRERGKQGQVRQVLRDENRVIVQGVNMVKRHSRERTRGTPAGIIEKEAPLHMSKVKLVCQACSRPVRVSFRLRADGVKVRVCRKCGQDID